jgi:hypothetical protein
MTDLCSCITANVHSVVLSPSAALAADACNSPAAAKPQKRPFRLLLLLLLLLLLQLLLSLSRVAATLRAAGDDATLLGWYTITGWSVKQHSSCWHCLPGQLLYCG